MHQRNLWLRIGLISATVIAATSVLFAQPTAPEASQGGHDRTVNRYWLSASAVPEFTDIERQQGRTLADWIKRSNAKEELPNRRGHYILYRHRSPEDSSEIVYWFGPFERAEDVAPALGAPCKSSS